MHYFQMNGKEVYNTGIKVLPKAINEVFKDVGLDIQDIDYMVPHQPSIRILKETAKIIGLPFQSFDKYGSICKYSWRYYSYSFR